MKQRGISYHLLKPISCHRKAVKDCWSQSHINDDDDSDNDLGYWHQRADERHDNPPQGNQELLVVRDKVGRPPG